MGPTENIDHRLSAFETALQILEDKVDKSIESRDAVLNDALVRLGNALSELQECQGKQYELTSSYMNCQRELEEARELAKQCPNTLTLIVHGDSPNPATSLITNDEEEIKRAAVSGAEVYELKFKGARHADS